MTPYTARGCATSPRRPRGSSRLPALTIVCFGDSVTLGVPHVPKADAFPAVLERRLNARLGSGRRCRVLNAGVGGENCAEGLVRIERDVLAHAPQIVVVEFGLNDVRYEPDKGLPVPQFAANLRTIAEQVRAVGSAVVFTTPNPVINSLHPYSLGVSYYDRWGGCNQALEEYAEAVRDVCSQAHAPCCDVHAAFVAKAIAAEFRGEVADYRDLVALTPYISREDGVHPTARGHYLIAQELYRVLRDLLPAA